MALFDLLGRRWTLRVLWELRESSAGFRELQSRCEGMSSSVLSQRLYELREAGVVIAERGSRYSLTAEGAALLEALAPLHQWAARWSEREPPSAEG